MSDQEILDSAIEKAESNGWDSIYHDEYHPLETIFDKNFAKALWGEQTDTLIVQNNSLNVQQVIDMNGWRYHLQRMVVAEDPIKYLGENI